VARSRKHWLQCLLWRNHWSTHPVSGDHLGELVEADVPDWGMNEGLLDNSACVSDAILLLNSS
jgi:hypothetical protein